MQRKNLILFVLAILAFVSGFLSEYFYPNQYFPVSDVPLLFIAATLIFVWYYLDSNEINFKRGMLQNIAIVGLGLIAFPVYFFRSRGAKTGTIYTLSFIGLVLLWQFLRYFGVLVAGYTA